MKVLVLAAAALSIALAGCGEKTAEARPEPRELTAEATGHYCGMSLTEHAGPKGQIFLASQSEPVWFSSARDVFSFMMLAEEPKDIRAAYVSDMGRAPSWDDPGSKNWIEARSAHFVIGSSKRGGMGAPETVPFSDLAVAEKFAAEHGGRVVAFADMPRDYVLTSEPAAGGSEKPGEPHDGAAGAH